MNELTELSTKYLACKSGPAAPPIQQGYTEVYFNHLNHRKNEIKKVLEIGIQGGGSLRMWRDFFPNATVYGIDMDRRSCFQEERIECFQGKQEDLKFLKEKIVPLGPFDFIVDDGSHVGEHQIATLQALWPSVAPKGIYVVEDLQPFYSGRHGASEGIINYLRKTVDDIHNRLQRPDTLRSLYSTEFYLGLCFLTKK